MDNSTFQENPNVTEDFVCLLRKTADLGVQSSFSV